MMSLSEKEKHLRSELQKIRKKKRIEDANRIYQFVLSEFGTTDIEELTKMIESHNLNYSSNNKSSLNANEDSFVEWEGF